MPYGSRRLAAVELQKFKNTNKQRWAFLVIYWGVAIPLGVYLSLNPDFVAWSVSFEKSSMLFRILYLALFTLALCLPVLTLNIIAFFQKPTHLEFGPRGMRLHWLHCFGKKSTGAIPWNAITYVNSSVKVESGVSLASLLVSVDRNEAGSDSKLLSFASKTLAAQLRDFLTRKTDSEIKFPISQILLCRDTDSNRVVNALKQYLPAEKVDITVDSFCLEKDHDFTTLWLEQLSMPTGFDCLEPGTRVAGRYVVERRIGSGGQAVTYLAHDLQNSSGNAKVVLKEFVLPIAGGREITTEHLRRVEQESRLLKRLDHPNIVSCFDTICEGRRAYLVLDYVEGETLDKRVLNGGTFSEESAVQIAIQMCELLNYLHGLSPPVVHRDFTPDNMILKSDGSIVLIDFNVAKQLESGNATHTVVGKHSYIPPEQFRGQACPQSDIYALGCTLYYLMTGEEPEPISVSHPKDKVVKLSDRINDIVSKATQQDLNRRYESAAEIQSDLETVSLTA